MVMPRKAIRRKKQFSGKGIKQNPKIPIQRKIPIQGKPVKPKTIVIFTGGYAEGKRIQQAFNGFLAKKRLTGKFKLETRNLVEPEISVPNHKKNYVSKVRTIQNADALLIDPILLEKLKKVFPDGIKFLHGKKIFEIEESMNWVWEKQFHNLLNGLSKKK